MSTNSRAWLLGALVGGSAIGLINQRFIDKYQKEMLFYLRKAIAPTGHVQSLIADEARSVPIQISFFSRETMNLALIYISDRFIMQSRSE